MHPLEDAFSHDASRFLWKKAHNVLYLGMYLISITYLSASNQSYIPHLNHVKTYRSLLSILQLFLLFLQNTFHTPGRRQSKNANTIEERRSKISRNSVFDWQLSPHWRQMAIHKHCFYRFLIRVSQLLITFLIAAYPVCFRAMAL